MNFIGISVICAALISVSMGILGANYEKPEVNTHAKQTTQAPAVHS